MSSAIGFQLGQAGNEIACLGAQSAGVAGQFFARLTGRARRPEGQDDARQYEDAQNAGQGGGGEEGQEDGREQGPGHRGCHRRDEAQIQAVEGIHVLRDA